MVAKASKVEKVMFPVPGTSLETNAYISKQENAPWRLICIPGTPSQTYLFSRLLRIASDELDIIVINRLGFHKSHTAPVLNFIVR